MESYQNYIKGRGLLLLIYFDYLQLLFLFFDQ